MTIHKWTVAPFSLTEFTTEYTPRWLAAAWQGETLVVWCEARVPSQRTRTRLTAVPTGGEIPSDNHYVGTAMHPTLLDGAPLVMHVYAREVE